MAAGPAATLEALTKRLGYTFSDTALLRRALTHSSARSATRNSKNNERLEFLGDRVLGLCVAEMLMAEFPDAPEGELALRFNRLVRKETCAAVAQDDWDLGRSIVMSGGEALGGGRRKITILGNACEAVLGAIFLDGGIAAARQTVSRFWAPRLLEPDDVPRDAKTALQEWAQGRGLALPRYEETERSGPDHAPRFVIRVEVEKCEPALGEGASKRIAEQNAAREMLIRQKVWNRSEDHG